jgi:D-xylose transport system substrate-binding protein
LAGREPSWQQRIAKAGGARLATAAVLVLVAAVLIGGLMVTRLGHRRHRMLPGKAPVIGFSLDSLVVERWQKDLDIFSRSARDLGADLILKVANQDPVVQERQVRELMAQGIDVLVIVPNDADRLSAVVTEVKASGIPVLSYDRLVRRAGVDLYLSFDNEKVGALMAGALAQAVPSGNYVIINGAKSDNNAVLLSHGIHQVLDPQVAAGKVQIISEIWPSDWNSGEAKSSLEAIVTRNRRIDAVIAGNDMLAEAAINVLSENRLMGKVRVAGQDAELAACQRIAEGSQFATVYKPIDRLALKAAGFAVMLAKGEPIGVEAVIYDGAGFVPYGKLEPVLVTKDRLTATVIKDGFHEAKDVFRNVMHR